MAFLASVMLPDLDIGLRLLSQASAFFRKSDFVRTSLVAQIQTCCAFATKCSIAMARAGFMLRISASCSSA